MRNSLNPTLRDRVYVVVRPSWIRNGRARRLLAAGLVILAIALLLVPRATPTTRSVVVAARALSPGVSLVAADLRVAEYPVAVVADGVIADTAGVLGRRVVGPVAAGEPLTSARILAADTAELIAPGWVLVPIDVDAAPGLGAVRAGDVIDVLRSADDGSGTGRGGDAQSSPEPAPGSSSPIILAERAIVVVAPGAGEANGAGASGGSGARVLTAGPGKTSPPALLAMAPGDGADVAAAALEGVLAILIRPQSG